MVDDIDVDVDELLLELRLRVVRDVLGLAGRVAVGGVLGLARRGLRGRLDDLRSELLGGFRRHLLGVVGGGVSTVELPAAVGVVRGGVGPGVTRVVGGGISTVELAGVGIGISTVELAGAVGGIGVGTSTLELAGVVGSIGVGTATVGLAGGVGGGVSAVEPAGVVVRLVRVSRRGAAARTRRERPVVGTGPAGAAVPSSSSGSSPDSPSAIPSSGPSVAGPWMVIGPSGRGPSTASLGLDPGPFRPRNSRSPTSSACATDAPSSSIVGRACISVRKGTWLARNSAFRAVSSCTVSRNSSGETVLG